MELGAIPSTPEVEYSFAIFVKALGLVEYPFFGF
tara:strand:+ start:619 stop:720 length:102 start_codon:yes stop_codon:yes gene_type:complete